MENSKVYKQGSANALIKNKQPTTPVSNELSLEKIILGWVKSALKIE